MSLCAAWFLWLYWWEPVHLSDQLQPQLFLLGGGLTAWRHCREHSCKLDSIQYTVNSEQYTVYSVQCIVSSVQCTLLTTDFRCTTQFTKLLPSVPPGTSWPTWLRSGEAMNKGT